VFARQEPILSTYTQDNFAFFIQRFPVRVAFEIGCRDGEDSKAILDKYKPERLVCMECNPEAIENLERDTQRFPAITVIPKAATDSDGIVEFWRVVRSVQWNGDVGRNIGASSLYKQTGLYGEHYDQERIEVPSTRVETVCNELGIDSIDLVCMDVQGAALTVLKGFGEILNRTRFIITELEFMPIYEGQALATDVAKFLFDYGFCLLGAHQQTGAFGDLLFGKEN
jgi:FkbM family methyltransferase